MVVETGRCDGYKQCQGRFRGRILVNLTSDGDSPTEPTVISPTGISRDALDPDALRSVERLQDRGYEAYLVGGCVRDLLLSKSPKDFDIATSARPQQVKRTFPRNCRIIGRRFKLAHLHFYQNTKILEVATFRTAPPPAEDESEDLLITRDNEFGTAEEDARRRDFTVNALFLDPHDDRVIDYVGGLEDLHNRQLRTIGQPAVRFREDPIRILRAAKFAGRLNFGIEAQTYAAMKSVAPDLSRAAPPRVLEEILRLLRGGHALESFQILRDIGALQVMLPVLGNYLATAPTEERIVFWRLLEALDAHVLATSAVPPTSVLLGALLLRAVMLRFDQAGRRSATILAEEMLGPLSLDLRLPRRDAGSLKRICGVQPRFTAHGSTRFRVESFLHDTHFEEALLLCELHCQARGDGFDDLERWRQLAAEAGVPRGPVEVPIDLDAVDDADDDDAEPGQPSAPRTERAPESNRGEGDRPRRRRRRGRRGRDRDRDERPAASQPAADRAAADRAAADRPGTERHQAAPPNERRRKRKNNADRHGEAGRPAGNGSTRGSRRSRRGEPRPPQVRVDKRSDKVETIEPEPEDLTAFDVELDPKRVPTFGALVEKDARRRPRDRAQSEDTDYKPPPPPGPEGPQAPPPPPGDEEFGDW